MRLQVFENVTTEDIISAEEEKGFTFPDTYKKFLIETNGGIIEPETASIVEIPETDEKIKLSVFYGLNLDEERNIMYHNRKYSDDIGQDSLIIGADSFGNYIVLIPYDGKINVCYWDINLKLSISSEEANAYIISDSFDDFLKAVGGIEIKNINKKGDKKMDRINYYALGSIVLLEGGIKKILITSRGLIVKKEDKEIFFDYAGVLYPEGLVSDKIVYFNHDNITKVIFEGYTDDDDEIVVNNINKFLEQNPNIEKGDVNNWEE